MEFDRDVKVMSDNIDAHIRKEVEMGVRADGISEAEKVNRRNLYSDDLVLEFSKIKKKK